MYKLHLNLHNLDETGKLSTKTPTMRRSNSELQANEQVLSGNLLSLVILQEKKKKKKPFSLNSLAEISSSPQALGKYAKFSRQIDRSDFNRECNMFCLSIHHESSP